MKINSTYVKQSIMLPAHMRIQKQSINSLTHFKSNKWKLNKDTSDVHKTGYNAHRYKGIEYWDT